MTFEDTTRFTSSPDSAGGPTRSDLLDGRIFDPHGPEVARASLSAPPAAEPEQLTLGISGRSLVASSPSADLQFALASRLLADLEGSGSPEYALTWSSWAMPSGLQICRLRAWAHRTSGNACGGWQTPTAVDGRGRAYQHDQGHKAKPRLTNAGNLQGWGTPTSRDGKDGIHLPANAAEKSRLGQQALLAGWPTPVANDDNKNPEAHLAMKARMGGNRTAITSLQVMAKTTVLGQMSISSPAPTGERGALAPALSLWLMGLPPEWLSCAPPAMPSSLKSRPRS